MSIVTKDKDVLQRLRHELAQRDVEQSDEKTMYDVFTEGCVGWDNFEDDHVVEQYIEYFGQETYDDICNSK